MTKIKIIKLSNYILDLAHITYLNSSHFLTDGK